MTQDNMQCSSCGRAIAGAELQALIAQSLASVPEPVVKAYLSFTGLKADE